LRSFEDLNKDMATEISWFAMMYHGVAADEITNVITDFITSVSREKE